MKASQGPEKKGATSRLNTNLSAPVEWLLCSNLASTSCADLQLSSEYRITTLFWKLMFFTDT